MKRNFGIAILGLVMMTAFPSCEKDFEEEELNLSNSVPAYVEFVSESASVEQGSDLTTQVQMPTTQTSASTVSYEVSGAFSTTGSLDLAAESYRTDLTLSVPDIGLDSNATDVATLTLTSISSGYQVGRTEGEKTTFTINISGPTAP